MRPAPALDALLHAVPLAALVLLVVNDHLLKPNHPGFWSGKLSDVAVMALLPFLFLASFDLLRLRWPRLPAPGVRSAMLAALVAIAVFVGIEVVPTVADTYRWGLGAAQWPVRVVVAFVEARPAPALTPVMLTADPSDLLTLPTAFVILVVRPWRA